MASQKGFEDPEKKVTPSTSDYDVEQGVLVDEKGRTHHGRKSTVVESIVAADLLDDRYEITQRGLKSRHAQMIVRLPARLYNIC
jgi:hypothetical protein